MPDRPALVRLDATVLGRVQGVGFRYFVLREAMALGVDRLGRQHAGRLGPLRRRGPRDRLEDAPRALCAQGPPAAIVDRVIVAWMPATGTLGPFELRSGGHPGD